MANSKRPLKEEVKWAYDVELEGLTYTARRDIERGEEVCISYGENTTNKHIFLQYGFVREQNELFDSIQMTVKLDETDPMYEEKLNLINQMHHTQNFTLS